MQNNSIVIDNHISLEYYKNDSNVELKFHNYFESDAIILIVQQDDLQKFLNDKSYLIDYRNNEVIINIDSIYSVIFKKSSMCNIDKSIANLKDAIIEIIEK